MALRTILSNDGGGYRGVMQLEVLRLFEEMLGEPIMSFFDLAAGVSNGAYITLPLARRVSDGKPIKTAQEIMDLYIEFGQAHFPHNRKHKLGHIFRGAAYSPHGIERVLKSVFGDMKMSDIRDNVMVISYDTVVGGPAIFSTWRARGETLHGERTGINPSDDDYMICDVIRGTTAAPTYFPPHHMQSLSGAKQHTLVDGGIYTNNPALDAGLYDFSRFKREERMMLSIGTGLSSLDPALKPRDKSLLGNWGAIHWARNLFSVTSNARNSGVNHQLERLMGENYYRIDLTPQIVSKLKRSPSKRLDDASPENAAALIECGKWMFDMNIKLFEEVAGRLKAERAARNLPITTVDNRTAAHMTNFVSVEPA